MIGYSGSLIGWFIKPSGSFVDWRTQTKEYTSLHNIGYFTEAQQKMAREQVEYGLMIYNTVGSSIRPVTISPIAPYTGSISFTVTYDSCESAKKQAMQIIADIDQNNSFGFLSLTPIIDNYMSMEPAKFNIEVSHNNPNAWNCIDIKNGFTAKSAAEAE